MTRDAGFDRMDVSTSFDDDPKFRSIARRHPEQLAVAAFAYMGLLARSWREGERLTLEEGWPALLPFDEQGAAALAEAGLVDEEARIPPGPWEAWFGTARKRRELGRERQHRADVNRGRVRQSGSQADSPSGSQSGPSPDQRRSSDGANDEPTFKGNDATTCPSCGDGPLIDTDPNIATDRWGQGWHKSCPTAAASGLRVAS